MSQENLSEVETVSDATQVAPPDIGFDAAKAVGFPKSVQADWEATPESIRYHALRRLGETLSGYAGHKTARQEAEVAQAELEQRVAAYEAAWQPIEPFDQLAREIGTTLVNALELYVGIERLLRNDPPAGIMYIMQRARLDPVAFARNILSHVEPQQTYAPQTYVEPSYAPQPYADQDMAEIKQELAALRSQVRSGAIQGKARLSAVGAPSNNGASSQKSSSSAREALERALQANG